MTDRSPSQRFQLEVIKLLLQVAWADHEIDESEVRVIFDYATRVGLVEADMRLLERYIAGTAPLPPPDMGLLRQRKQEALLAVQTLLLSDAAIDRQEREILADIEAVLDESEVLAEIEAALE